MFTNKWLSKTFAHFWPHTCILCQSTSSGPISLCQDCCEELPYLHQNSFENELFQNKPSTEESHTHFSKEQYQSFSVFSYRSPIERLIKQLKFKNGLVIAEVLGALMAQKIQEVYMKTTWPDQLIPMPLHAKRIKQIGFNPIVELSRPIARRLALPINYHACHRTRNTLHNFDQSFFEKLHDLSNAFLVNKHLRSEYVCIISDLCVTGATAVSFANSLFEKGVKRVDVWFCARTS